MIYLDNAATTKPKKEVIDAIMPYLTDMWYNPSSLYSPSVKIKEDIERARETIANFINANNDEIYFTSGGSESNSWVIQGFANECWSHGSYPIIITSTIEHKSILDCVNGSGAKIFFVGTDNKGLIHDDELENVLMKVIAYGKEEFLDYKILVSIHLANNEIGVVQHAKLLSDITHEYGGLFHADAVQAFGHIPINVKDLGIDMLSASGHKIGALKGSGFLYKKDGVNIKPLVYGAQENGMRGGTENVIGVIGLGEAIKCIDFGNNYEYIEDMISKRNYFIDLLESKFGCGLNGHDTYRLPNNINVTFPQNITGEALLYTLDLSDVRISTGSACNSHSIEPSYVLKAIGLSNEEAMRTVRFTLPNDITYQDIDKVIEEIDKAIQIIELEVI